MAENGSPDGWPGVDLGDREPFALLLVEGLSVAEACDRLQIAPRTGYRWAARDDVARFVASVRARIVEGAVNRLASASTRAVAKLESLMDSGEETTQLNAAKTILAALPKIQDLAGRAEREAKAPAPGPDGAVSQGRPRA